MAIIVRAVPRSAAGSAEDEAAALQRTFEEDTPVGRLVALLPASDPSSVLAVFESTESSEFANLSE
jgi:hypothetical protein